MAHIVFDNVSIDFPIYNSSGRSLKKSLLSAATGGRVGADPDGKIVVRALDGINLNITDGDCLGIVGHNGAGKSTFLRALSGIYKPSSGSVTVVGEVGSLIDISLGIDSEATGRENIFLRGALLGLSHKEISSRIDQIIEFSELGEFIDFPVRTYSSGMLLRLAFSVSTSVHPEILLMDEWLSVGDEGFRHKAARRLSELVKSTNILVFASHSRSMIEENCNRVIWLEHGKLVMDGDAEYICEKYFGVNDAI